MDDTTTPTLSWLAFALAFDASARHCQHIRQSLPEPAAIGRLITAYLDGQTEPLQTALHGQLDNTTLARLSDASLRQRINRTLAWQQSSPVHHLIGFDHPLYPSLLRLTPDAPPLLYAKGNLAALKAPAMAMVGSRKASRQAIDLTHALAAELAADGIVVVSGLAQGIDAAAHMGALAVGGTTIAVAATAPDAVYPKRHASLEQRIIDEQGLVLTEYPLGATTLRWHFPRRNRIISGISMGVLVAEAGLPSGTLTTATHAMNQGREVMAIPGSVKNLQARGCHSLIKQGAALVECAQDILDVLAWPLSQCGYTLAATQSQHEPGSKQQTLALDEALPDTPEGAILALLDVAPSTIDELMALTGRTVTELGTMLGMMEIDGVVKAGAGGRYTRCQARELHGL